MRRREAGKDFGEYEEEHQHIRPDNQYPGYGPERPRSVSNGSVHSAITANVAPYPPARRPSVDNGYADQSRYQTPQPTGPPPVTTGPYPDHLAFGGAQYGAATFQPPPAPINRPVTQYPATGTVHYASPSHSRRLSNAPDYTYSGPVPHSSPYRSASRHSSASDLGAIRNDPSTPPQPLYQTQPPMNPYMDPQYGMVNQDQYGSSYPPSSQASNSSTNGLPPLPTMPYHPDPKPEAMSQGIPMSASTTPQHYDGPPGGFPFPSSSHPGYPTQPITTAHANPYLSDMTSPAQARSRKRGLDQVFDNTALQQPMQNGMRPSVDHVGQDFAPIEGADEMDEYPDLSTLKYKRADGRQQVKKAPSPVAD